MENLLGFCSRSPMYFKSMKNKSFLFLFIIFASFFLMISCGQNVDHEDNTYIVATDATLPPMSFMSVGNEITGFEPDLMKAIAKKAGFKIRMINVEWAGLFGGLITN